MAKTERGERTGGRGRRIGRLLVALGVTVGTLGVAPQAAEADTLPLSPFRSDACGALVAKTRTTSWSCTLAEDFDGTTLDASVWNVQTTAGSGFGQGGECFVNSPGNVAVSNGTLKLTVRKEAAPFTCSSPFGDFTSQYTAGTVNTGGKFNQTYGRFEIKAKMPRTGRPLRDGTSLPTNVPGLQFAYWLWPEDVLKHGNQWPMSGEIDVMEWYSLNSTLGIPSIHYWHYAYDPNITNYNCVVGDMSQWHTYTLEWSERGMQILYDGQLCLRNMNIVPENGISRPAPFDHPFMVALTQALGFNQGTSDQNINGVTSSTPLPATAEIDYLKVWK